MIIESRVKTEDDNVGASCDAVRVSVVGTCPISWMLEVRRQDFATFPWWKCKHFAIICNITLAQVVFSKFTMIHADETKSSLQFASRNAYVLQTVHM
ncbi:hypothetical protein IFM89_009177 [Coptis chinensis]|uniref:Uncharacterized protein n=1 Tax=Coptis chinensis TaxID=261450 RepID=A0A835IVQ8_9MAGN|nr:hypothetical protein IFM89_009177 [Coptis chinensis]